MKLVKQSTLKLKVIMEIRKEKRKNVQYCLCARQKRVFPSPGEIARVTVTLSCCSLLVTQNIAKIPVYNNTFNSNNQGDVLAQGEI